MVKRYTIQAVERVCVYQNNCNCKMLKSYEYEKGKLRHVEFTEFILVFTVKLIKFALALVSKTFHAGKFCC